MELNLQRQAISINEVVYHETVEQAVECDAMLPDYCPDISKVLKCAVSVSIGSAEISDKRLNIEGMALIRVYYQSDGEGVRRVEYKVPFAKAVELPNPVHAPVVTVTPSLDYVNCRAVSQRRLDVRGAVSLAVKIAERGNAQVICHAEGGGLQLRQQMVNATELSGQAESTFSVTEELELAHGKPAIGNILRSECHVNVHDCKVVSGKVVAKADLMVHVTYQPQNTPGRLEMMDYTLPISQIIDAAGVDEDNICDVSMQVLSCDIQPQAGESGEYLALSLEARLKAVVAAHRHLEIPVASDCYSTKFACSCKHDQVSFLYLEKILRETIMHRAALELPEGTTEVLDVWCEVEAMEWRQKLEELALTLRLTVCMFARMADADGVMYFEQSTDLEQSYPLSCRYGGKMLFEPTCDVLSCSFGLTGQEKMEIRCEISIRGCVYCAFKQPTVSEIALDEGSPCQKDANKLILYYADQDESVWDIAKRYKTSANAIWEENDIQSDLLPVRRMLLIPIV